MVISDGIEHALGIFPHLSTKDRPLSSVAMHPCHDTVAYSTFQDAAEEFVENNYYAIFGLDLMAFLSLPQHMVRTLREIGQRNAKARKNAISAVERELSQQSR